MQFTCTRSDTYRSCPNLENSLFVVSRNTGSRSYLWQVPLIKRTTVSELGIVVWKLKRAKYKKNLLDQLLKDPYVLMRPIFVCESDRS